MRSYDEIWQITDKLSASDEKMLNEAHSLFRISNPKVCNEITFRYINRAWIGNHSTNVESAEAIAERACRYYETDQAFKLSYRRLDG